MYSTCVVLATVLAQGPVFEAEIIFQPQPKHNHSSSIVETPEGDLLACWFHGSGERRSDDVQIVGARKRKGASAWSDPFPMADTPDLPDCNPVLFVDPRGTLWLFWITVQNNEWGGSLLKYRVSRSYAKDGPPEWHWQEVIHCRPQNLEPMFLETLAAAEVKYAELLKGNERLRSEVEQMKSVAKDKLAQRLGWMTRLHPIVLSESHMMLGLYSDVFNCSLAAFTKDWGKTWEFSKPILSTEIGNIQPAFVQRKNGDILAFMRDNGIPKRIRKAVSTDGGLSWGTVEPMEISNPGSSVDCIALAGGHWALVCNDTSNGRHILSVYLSDDEGENWKWKRRIEDFPPEQGSASYPSLIQAEDGSLHVTYSYTSKEFDGSTIKHARFNKEWIQAETQ